MDTSPETAIAPPATTNNVSTPPVFLNLGKEKKKRIKDLKRGRGKLMDEVTAAVEEVRLRIGDAMDGKLLVPVVLVYRQKRRRKRGRGLLFPFLS